MLVICNGAFKNGSTWLFEIIKRLDNFNSPPNEYLKDNWNAPSLRIEKIDDLLLNEIIQNENYIVKNHISEKHHKERLLESRNVRVVNIKRDLRDVVVSVYFHYRRKKNMTISFEDFYWNMGRYEAKSIYDYHKLWSGKNSNVHLCIYEKLKNEFSKEVRRLATFLDLSISDERITKVKKDTEIDTINKRRQEKIFRGTNIGEYKDFLTPLMIYDLRTIICSGFSILDYIHQYKKCNTTKKIVQVYQQASKLVNSKNHEKNTPFKST